ncbi:MAG TPA: phage holin family protein [Usitatibacter sp.]|nr:phage holin family protein [Usitatibacter sp.]
MDQQAEPVSPAGLTAPLRALGATLVELVGARAELAVVELRQEGERKKEMIALAAAGALFLALGLLVATLFVIVLFWDTHRLAAIGGVAILYLVLSAAAFLRLRHKAASNPPPFEATLREFAADREMLGGGADGTGAADE